jgi:hypothetical protein
MLKKSFLFLLILSVVYLGWSKIRTDQCLYLKKETYIRHLKKDLFVQKLHSALPSWMLEQIDEDFFPFQTAEISKKRVDATWAKIRETLTSPMIVRYRILNNRLYRYFSEGELISLEDNSTELALKTLLESMRFPDMDFIISFFDGITPKDQYFKVSEDLQAPVFFSAKVINTPYVILIPDWRSIGHWWISDIKHIQSRAEKFPWEKKKDFAVWRGSLTKRIRHKLCQISKLYPQYLDAKFNSEENPEVKKELMQEGLFGDRVSWEEFLECKYLPVMDGVVCAAPAFQWRLLSNSVTLKPDSNEVQWFYRDLKPYVHYIPLKSDLSDLIEKLDWAKEHDSQCKEIASRATQFAKEFLMYEDILLYFAQVLIRYAKLQMIDTTQISKEMQDNPCWVCIQYRNRLKKQAEKQQMKGYFPYATPF